MAGQSRTQRLADRELNTRKKCKLDSCYMPRVGFTGYCNYHERNAYWHGHPLSKLTKPKEYEGDKEAVAELFRDNSQHAGLLSATAWADQWLADSVAGRASAVAPMEMSRLAAHGVKGLDVVTECAALWLLSTRHPSRLQDDIRLTYAMGNGVLRLAPLEKRSIWRGTRIGKFRSYQPPGKTRRLIGEHVRSVLGHFLMNVSQAVLAKAAEADERQVALSTPF